MNESVVSTTPSTMTRYLGGGDDMNEKDDKCIHPKQPVILNEKITKLPLADFEPSPPSF